jgi:hypothetical protein
MKSIKVLTLLISAMCAPLTHCCQPSHNPNNLSPQSRITYRLATSTERLHLPKRMALTEFQYVGVTKTNAIVARCCIDIDLKTKNLNLTHYSVDEKFRHHNIRNALIAFAKNDLTKHVVSMPEE